MVNIENDLILHPLRYRLLHMLLGKRLTTRQIARDLPGVPVSSIYRHLKILLDAGMVQVIETRRVKGIDEKVYTVGELPNIKEEDVANVSQRDWQRYFASYLSYLMKGFSDYLADKDSENIRIENAGFTDDMFYATTEELEDFARMLNAELNKLKQNEKNPQRQRQLFSVITFPLERKD